MNALCLLLRHRWRVEDIDGESYEVCVRCRHYRNDVHWRDINAGKPRTPLLDSGGDGYGPLQG